MSQLGRISFLSVAAIGVLLVPASSWADEAEAVNAVEMLGGKVTVTGNRTGELVVGVALGNDKVTDAGLKKLKALKSLRNLHLHYTSVTDAGLKELRELKSLQELALDQAPVTD